MSNPDSPELSSTLPKTPLSVVSVSVKKKLLFLILGGITAIVLISFGAYFFIQQANAATISGVISYTALKPDATDKGQVLVQARKYGTNELFKTVYTSVLAEGSPWIWKNAVSGQPYEMTASLVIDGKVVTTSEPLIVSAPAETQ